MRVALAPEAWTQPIKMCLDVLMCIHISVFILCKVVTYVKCKKEKKKFSSGQHFVATPQWTVREYIQTFVEKKKG